MNKSRILVVDDEEIMRSSLTDWLTEDGYYVLAVADGQDAIERVKVDDWDLAIIDLKMPKMDGIEVMKRIKSFNAKLPVIIITAYATIDSAVMAMKEGAVDYIVKPFNPDEISLIIAKLVEHQRLVKENIHLRRELTKRFRFHDLISKSAGMQKVVEMIRTVAPTKSTVLIRGESGTGKELVARAIHELGPNRKFAFIAASCAAIPEALLEAELFGYEKGAFTGAVNLHKGRIELADKGTLFLDEIGDVSIKNQIDLLRFLQERNFRRVGGSSLIKADIRVIAATNKNLEALITKGEFRDDLYYRLNVITIEVPPLRERKEDIPVLIEHFLEKYSVNTGKTINRVTDEAMSVFMNYDWPGNVRQLENAIEHAVVITKESEITPDDLPRVLIGNRITSSVIQSDLTLEQLEKQHILAVLNSSGWNVKKAARVLGVNRATIYNKIRKYKLNMKRAH